MCVFEKSYFSFLFYVYHRFEALFLILPTVLAIC